MTHTFYYSLLLSGTESLAGLCLARNYVLYPTGASSNDPDIPHAYNYCPHRSRYSYVRIVTGYSPEQLGTGIRFPEEAGIFIKRLDWLWGPTREGGVEGFFP